MSLNYGTLISLAGDWFNNGLMSISGLLDMLGSMQGKTSEKVSTVPKVQIEENSPSPTFLGMLLYPNRKSGPGIGVTKSTENGNTQMTLELFLMRNNNFPYHLSQFESRSIIVYSRLPANLFCNASMQTSYHKLIKEKNLNCIYKNK